MTDLPYGTIKGIKLDGMCGKTDWDNIININKVMTIANRILRQRGKMILFGQQPFTTNLINSQTTNIIFNYSMIWKKDHFANNLISKKAPVNYYEDVLVFSKQHDSNCLHPLRAYFKNVFNYIGKKKKQIIQVIGHSADHCFRVDTPQFSLCTQKTYNKLIEEYKINNMKGFKKFLDLLEINAKFNTKFNATFNLWEGRKIKSNILEYKKDYDGFHPTQKPILLLEDLIKTFSNENDLVVDLTMGSGSTGVACLNTKRNFIGIELDEYYFNISKKRIDSAY